MYSVEPDLVSSLLKKGQHFSKTSEAIPRPLENKVKKDKKADVKELMAFFEVPEDEKDFYACVLGSVEGVMRDEVDEFNENEPFDKLNKSFQLNFCSFFGIIESSIYLS